MLWSRSTQPSSARKPVVPTRMLLVTELLDASRTRTKSTSPTKKSGVPGIALIPSGPDRPLFAPAQLAFGLQPVNALAPLPVACVTAKVPVSMMSTDLLLRSVK